MSKQEITHKELLTFSNAVNLSWEFVDLEAIKEGDYDAGQGAMDEISTQLNDLLTPEVFVREIKNEETGETDDLNIYGSDIEGNYLGEEQGLIEMRQEAGIAMEYLEKQDGEGEFIKDWEVVYAADNYKIVVDYIDSLQEFLAEISDDIDSDDEPYPSREELEDMNRMEKLIEVGFRFAEGGLNVVTDYLGLNGKVSKNVVRDIGKNLTKKAIKEGVERLDSLPLQILGSIFLNAEDIDAESILSMIKDGAGPIAERLQEDYNFDVEELIEELRAERISDDKLEDLV